MTKAVGALIAAHARDLERDQEVAAAAQGAQGLDGGQWHLDCAIYTPAQKNPITIQEIHGKYQLFDFSPNSACA